MHFYTIKKKKLEYGRYNKYCSDTLSAINQSATYKGMYCVKELHRLHPNNRCS